MKKEKEKVLVKCLGWCNEHFLSENKFLRFCLKCSDKKQNIMKTNSIFSELKILDQ
jgi:hypothetical protein